MRIVVVLPLPFGPEEAEDLPARDAQRDVVDDVLLPEALVQALDVDRIRASDEALIARDLDRLSGMQAEPPSAAGRASIMKTSLARFRCCR
jgi:hypothetical protein